MGWYLTITSEMRETGLSGTALLVYALIHGYSQQEQGCYYGSLAHTAEVVGCSAETARNTLKFLTENGFLTRTEFFENNVRRVAYKTTKKIWDTQEIRDTLPNNLGGSTQKIWDNNKGYNTNDKKEDIIRFTPPTLEKVSEYCRERGNNVDAVQFVNHYTANGWMVGKSRMKDWKAAVRTWEGRKSYKQAKLSPEERTIRALNNLQSRDGQVNTLYDEQ